MQNDMLKRFLEDDLDNKKYQVELIDDVIKLTNKDLVDFPMFIDVSDEHILIQASLLPYTEIPEDNISEIDDAVLRFNPIMPLSAIAKDKTGYIIYGELSERSGREEMVQEILTLEDNLVSVLEFFKEYV